MTEAGVIVAGAVSVRLGVTGELMSRKTADAGEVEKGTTETVSCCSTRSTQLLEQGFCFLKALQALIAGSLPERVPGRSLRRY